MPSDSGADESEDSDRFGADSATSGVSVATDSELSELVPAHLVLEPRADRWKWRQRVRQNRTQLAVYRCVVGIAGLLMVCLGFVTGPLPGPGGIPLVLLGLAIWSSEFEWAHRLMQFFKAQLHRFRQWPRRRQVLFWLIFFAACGTMGYSYLLTIGPPGWMPHTVLTLVQHLPGV